MTERLGDRNVGDRRAEAGGDRGRSEGQSGSGDRDRPRRLVVHLYDVATSAGGVLLVGLLIVAVSGVWPPLVAIESGSMEPQIQRGDLVFVMDEQRFPGEGAHGDTGVVTRAAATESGYEAFGDRGDVIVFQPGGDPGATPVIHRAMFWVEEGEDWTDKADERHLRGGSDCSELEHCEAPHAGFITKGDNNAVYDQVDSSRSNEPVKPEWVLGTAEYRVPYVGELRLTAREVLGAPVATETTGSPNGTVDGVGPAGAAP